MLLCWFFFFFTLEQYRISPVLSFVFVLDQQCLRNVLAGDQHIRYNLRQQTEQWIVKYWRLKCLIHLISARRHSMCFTPLVGQSARLTAKQLEDTCVQWIISHSLTEALRIDKHHNYLWKGCWVCRTAPLMTNLRRSHHIPTAGTHFYCIYISRFYFFCIFAAS